MTTDPDPFEEGQNAARKNIPAGGSLGGGRGGPWDKSANHGALAQLAQGPWQALQASETAFGRSVALRSRPAADAGGDAPEGDFDRDHFGGPVRISARATFGAASTIKRVAGFILSASRRPRLIVVERQPTFFRPFLNRGPLMA
jgi:hypothetical protein